MSIDNDHISPSGLVGAGLPEDPIMDPADIPLAVSVRPTGPTLEDVTRQLATEPSVILPASAARVQVFEPMAAAFNEWQRRFIDTPEAFEREFQTVLDFMAAESNGETPSYGAACSAYLQKLMGELADEAERDQWEPVSKMPVRLRAKPDVHGFVLAMTGGWQVCYRQSGVFTKLMTRAELVTAFEPIDREAQP